MQKLFRLFDIQKKSVDEENATIDAIFSTSNEDRHGDVVEQDWDLKNFKNNPVILNSHSYSDASEVIGKAVNPKVEDGQLQGKIHFATEENPKAKIIFDLYAGGFLSAFSVGFIPKEFDDKGNIKKSELLEVSAVSVPSNAQALAKQKGIDIDKLYEQNGDDSKNKKGEKTDASDEGDSNKNGGRKSKKKTRGTGGTKKDKKETPKWYETEGKIIYQEKSIYDFKGELVRMEVKTSLPKVRANVGVLKDSREKDVQSYIFLREEGWTMEDSKKWISTKNYNDLYLGRDTNELIKKALENEKNRKIKALHKIYRAVELSSKELSKEELDSIQRQANNRLVNKAVKKLLDLKE